MMLIMISIFCLNILDFISILFTKQFSAYLWKTYIYVCARDGDGEEVVLLFTHTSLSDVNLLWFAAVI